MVICSKCVMPESPPNIILDSSGVCSLCVNYEEEKEKQVQQRKLLETDLLNILRKNKGKGKYDCLAMCSGGKDSTASLYYMVKRYQVRTLAFTFDHGFETNEALENIHRAVDKLEVDFMYFKTNYMKKFFSKMQEYQSKAVVCHPCSMWYMDLTFDMAARFDIPLIVAGWTKGQSTSSDSQIMSKCACSAKELEFKNMAEHTKTFIEKIRQDPETPQYKNFPRTMEEVLTRAKSKSKATVISPHWFLPFEEEVYVEEIKKELGWKQPVLTYPAKSTNCELNFLSVHSSLKNFGYTHYHVEFSKMIRKGLMTREEALKRLDFSQYKEGYIDQLKARLV